MQNFMLDFPHMTFPKIATKYVLTALFALYFVAVLFAVQRTRTMPDSGVELKIWILTAAFGLAISVVTYFLKKFIEIYERKTDQLQIVVDKKTESLEKKQTEQNEHIIKILGHLENGKEQQGYMKERLTRIESRLDVRKM